MAVRKTKKGLALKRWFKEDWKDVRSGKRCGRQKGEKRGTPYCRPSKRISKKTPKTVSEMSASEKRKRIAQKKGLVNLRVSQEEFNQQEGEKPNDPTTKENGDEEEWR